MTRVVKVLTAAAKNKWKQRARRRELRQRTGYDGPVNLPIGNYRFASFSASPPLPEQQHALPDSIHVMHRRSSPVWGDSRQDINWLLQVAHSALLLRSGWCVSCSMS